MFLSNANDFDDEDLGNGDIVVPLSLVASTPQMINGASRPGAANRTLEPESPRGAVQPGARGVRRHRTTNDQQG